jgi:hypothetical protein
MEYYDMITNWKKFKGFINGPKIENYVKLYCSWLTLDYRKNVPLLKLNTRRKEVDDVSMFVLEKLATGDTRYKYCVPHDCYYSNTYILPGFVTHLTEKKFNEIFILDMNIMTFTDKQFNVYPNHYM